MVLGQFTWHVLCWGVWHDYSDLDGALHCLQAPLQSSLARSSLTLLVALLVNVPVLLSFLIFILQTAGSVSDWYVLGRRFDRSRCFMAIVVGPWVLLLVSILSLLAVLSWSVRAYAVLGIVTGYFVLLPLLYATLERLVGQNRTEASRPAPERPLIDKGTEVTAPS